MAHPPSKKLLKFYQLNPDGTGELIAWNKALNDSDLIGIGKLTKITSIDLWNNDLNSIPPELSKLSNLTDLYLGRNNLNSIPPELSKLSNLTYLNLGRNKLNSIPPALSMLINLIQLNLEQNKIRLLPLEFKNLEKLQYLWLYDNPSMTFPPKEIMEKANANIDKTEEEWRKLVQPRANPKIIRQYLGTKEAEDLLIALFPPSSFPQDISNLFFPSY